jgi:hypothetical protein
MKIQKIDKNRFKSSKIDEICQTELEMINDKNAQGFQNGHMGALMRERMPARLPTAAQVKAYV